MEGELKRDVAIKKFFTFFLLTMDMDDTCSNYERLEKGRTDTNRGKYFIKNNNNNMF